MPLTPMVVPGPTLTPLSLSTFGMPVVNNLNITTAALTPALNEWLQYTPTWTADSGGAGIGSGFHNGRYMRIGEHYGVFEISQKFLTTSIGTGAYRWTLPNGWVAPYGSICGDVSVWDNSTTTTYVGVAVILDPDFTHVLSLTHNSGFTAGNVPFTFADNDTIRIRGILELE